ncbi:MAG: autotransporter outer membrane beta-barrel domain-containing protein [Hyphomicrobiales bacterium]|nr:autotransporter outer membrane beta-barrel domain-containing protein [Hyphomicrobiales bacterium]
MRVPVNIRAVDGLPGFSENEEGEIVIGDGTLDTDGDGAITIGNIINTFGLGTLGKDHFVAGEWLDNGVDDGDWELRLVCTGCDDPLVKSQWNVVAVPRQQNRPGTGGGPAVLAGPATLFDTLPMVLAHLGQPESLHRRTQNRSFQQGTGVWGRTQTGSVSIETTAAPFEVDAHNIAFGVHAPVFSRGVSESVTLNANVALQTSEIEALVADGKQDIQTNAVIGGVGATWKRGGLYADGQFQYARFDNDLDTADDTRLASPTADSFTAGVEVGYVFDGGDVNLGEWLGGGVLGNVFLTPSAQVSWSQVGFSDFVSTDGKAVSLDDGTVINGRVGAVFETNWENVVFYEAFAPAVVRLQGSADVIFPLDGEVVTLVDGAKQSSEREDPVLDLGVGVSYTWEKANHAYTLSTDVSSLQGSEVDGYEANVGFKYQF